MSTGTVTPHDTPASGPAGKKIASQRATRPSMRPYVARGILFGICLVVAFYDTFATILIAGFVGVEQDAILIFIMAFVLFAGLDKKRARALDIHDREVDYIIGGIVMIIAITIKVLLLPRFGEWDALLRLDIFAILVFAFGACGLIYGMRSTLHFGPGWALLFLYSAPAQLIVSTSFGGGWWGSAMASLIGVSLAVVIALNRDLVQKIYFGLFTSIIGLVIAGAMQFTFTPPGWLAHLPALLAMLLAMYNTSRGNPTHWVIRRRKPTVKNVNGAAAIVIVVTVILALNPVPKLTEDFSSLPAGPQTPPIPGVTVPPAWSVTEFQEFDWAGQYFGPGSSLVRQKFTANDYNPEWDQSGMMRTVAVDTLLASDYHQARAFGDETLYSTLNGRRSEALTVDLGYGIVGRVYTVLDESDFLTYTKLVFSWSRGNGLVENVTVIAVDDHRPEARFPQLAPSLGRMFTQVITILLRGNAVTIDAETEYKDLDLVMQVAEDIISWEMDR